jgi:predicted acyltransferase (DUF342 family)
VNDFIVTEDVAIDTSFISSTEIVIDKPTNRTCVPGDAKK